MVLMTNLQTRVGEDSASVVMAQLDKDEPVKHTKSYFSHHTLAWSPQGIHTSTFSCSWTIMDFTDDKFFPYPYTPIRLF